MRKYWLLLNKEFGFENGKLRISFSTDNPVYGKRFCVYIEGILVYDGTESGKSSWDTWIHHNPKIEKDVISILVDKLEQQKQLNAAVKELEDAKTLTEESRIKNIIDSY